MKEWKLATLTAIFLALLTSCQTLKADGAIGLRPNAPQLIDTEGNSRVKMIDGTRIVFMDLDAWKSIVRYINMTRPQDAEDLRDKPIKNAIITKDDFTKLLEEK